MLNAINLLTVLTPVLTAVCRLQEKAADTIESLHKAGMKVWVLTGDKMETAAATCYASKLFRRSTQILELTKKRTEEQSLHDVLFDLSRTVLRQRSLSRYAAHSHQCALAHSMTSTSQMFGHTYSFKGFSIFYVVE